MRKPESGLWQYQVISEKGKDTSLSSSSGSSDLEDKIEVIKYNSVAIITPHPSNILKHLHNSPTLLKLENEHFATTIKCSKKTCCECSPTLVHSSPSATPKSLPPAIPSFSPLVLHLMLPPTHYQRWCSHLLVVIVLLPSPALLLLLSSWTAGRIGPSTSITSTWTTASRSLGCLEQVLWSQCWTKCLRPYSSRFFPVTIYLLDEPPMTIARSGVLTPAITSNSF